VTIEVEVRRNKCQEYEFRFEMRNVEGTSVITVIREEEGIIRLRVIRLEEFVVRTSAATLPTLLH